MTLKLLTYSSRLERLNCVEGVVEGAPSDTESTFLSAGVEELIILVPTRRRRRNW